MLDTKTAHPPMRTGALHESKNMPKLIIDLRGNVVAAHIRMRSLRVCHVPSEVSCAESSLPEHLLK